MTDSDVAEGSVAQTMWHLWEHRGYYESVPATLTAELSGDAPRSLYFIDDDGSVTGSIEHIGVTIQGAEGTGDRPNIFRVVIHTDGLSCAVSHGSLNGASTEVTRTGANYASAEMTPQSMAVEAVEVTTDG